MTFAPQTRLSRIAAGSVALLGIVTGAVAQITGGMLPPGMDTPGKPFSYFWHPTDVLGIQYAPVASEVTPEGYIYTGFGELMFFTGNPPEPVNERIKTLYHDHLPAIQYGLERDGVSYEFTMFAADAGGAMAGIPINFVSVRLRNPGHEKRTAFIGAGVRFSKHMDKLNSPEYRFNQKFQYLPAEYTQGQTQFNPAWEYSFAPDALLRNGRLLYVFPAAPGPWQKSITLADHGFRQYRFLSGEIGGTNNFPRHFGPETVAGVVSYKVTLDAGASQSLVFRMPLTPVPEGSPAAAAVRTAESQEIFEQTMSNWSRLINDGASPLIFPEPKVQNALLANTIFNLLALDRLGEDYILNVNKFQYHRFYPTDSALMLAALDDMGLSEIAGKASRYNLKTQGKDGTFVVQPQLYEAFGHVLWAWDRHYRLTRDEQFLRDIYPAVVRGVEWERRVARQDPLGLLPASSVSDDAQLKDCHQTGQDLWALAGLQCAIRLAEAARRPEDAASFRAESSRLRAAFERQLAVQTAQTGGYIPPSLDRTLKGNDWDNLHTLYPEVLFDPADSRVDATIRHVRGTYLEGILPYVYPGQIAEENGHPVFSTERTLHYFHSTDNAMNQLVRNTPDDQKDAVADLYAILLHTASTHATQEYGGVPWSTRDYTHTHNILPDGSTSGVLIELMRNMLLREQGSDLHLFSALSPEWLKPGSRVGVQQAPSAFGPVTAILLASKGALEIQLGATFRETPKHILIHLPWFYDATRIEIDGKPAAQHQGIIGVPPGAVRVKVYGRIRPNAEPMSFLNSVEAYKREYRRRYEVFLTTGTRTP